MIHVTDTYMEHQASLCKHSIIISCNTLLLHNGRAMSPCWLVSQMRAPLAACREPAREWWQMCKVLYVFEHKTQNILIYAPFTRIVVFWHIDNVPPMIS